MWNHKSFMAPTGERAVPFLTASLVVAVCCLDFDTMMLNNSEEFLASCCFLVFKEAAEAHRSG